MSMVAVYLVTNLSLNLLIVAENVQMQTAVNNHLVNDGLINQPVKVIQGQDVKRGR